MDVFFEANKHNTTEKKDFPTLNTDFKKSHFAICKYPNTFFWYYCINLLYRCFVKTVKILRLIYSINYCCYIKQAILIYSTRVNLLFFH